MDALLHDPTTVREAFMALALAVFAIGWVSSRFRVRELERLNVRQADDLKEMAQEAVRAGSNAHTEAVDAMKDMHDNALSHLRSAVAETIAECLEQPGDDDKGY
jgi:hypothetical protein